MGSLSSLYVSQSYQSLLHLGTDTSFFPPLAPTPQGYITVQDGLGYNAGFAISSSGDIFFSKSVIVNEDLSINGDLDVDGNFIVSGTFDIEGKVTVNDNVRVNGNLEVSGATTLTGSLVVSNQITASNMWITNDLYVSGTLNAFKVVTTIESASVIFSSGSNILGDATNDTQTLIGDVIMSGSSSLTGSMGISANLNVGGNLNVIGNISSSTLSGVGNVSIYSASVNSRLAFLEGPFSTSVDLRLDNLEAWSSSLQTNFATQAELNATASFLQNQINQKLNTSSFNAYTQSTDARLNVIETTFATTGSNVFRGNQTITGSLILSSSAATELQVIGSSQFDGKVNGLVSSINNISQTASFDCSLANFYTLTLLSGSNTFINATNVTPGQTISLRVVQPNPGFGTVTLSSNIKFPQAFPYIPTPLSQAEDIITFVSYGNTLYGVAVNTMV